MLALSFCCLIAGLFVVVALSEAHQNEFAGMRPMGLLTWLVSGNWPAKVGSGLLIVGVGALLRFALLNVQVAPEAKLLSGALLCVSLFAFARVIRTRYGKHGIAAALTGAAFGCAYLTAYSAYALFHYLESFAGLAALAIVATAAGVYAVWRRTQSIALLAMFGAFLAPAFAVEAPSPGLVYGYYLAVSQLVLATIAIRGWRSLIHLSFLFTLAGGVFFAWTAEFYTPAHFETMQPLLIALSLVHVIMPLLERRGAQSKWSIRFDRFYFLALPLVSAASLLWIAPSTAARTTSLLVLGAVWIAAGIVARHLAVGTELRHAALGGLLMLVGLYMNAPELPWFLIGMALAVAWLWLLVKKDWLGTQEMAVSATVVFACLFLAKTLTQLPAQLVFFNTLVLERLTACALLIGGSMAARKLGHRLAGFLGWTGALGLINTLAFELHRWEFIQWPMAIHAAVVCAAFALFIAALYRNVSAIWLGTLSCAVTLTAWWAGMNAHLPFAYAMTVVAPLALFAMCVRSHKHESSDSSPQRSLAMYAALATAWVWASRVQLLSNHSHMQVALAITVGWLVVGLALAQWNSLRNSDWLAPSLPILGALVCGLIVVTTVISIERGPTALVLNALSVASLLEIALISRRGSAPIEWLTSASIIAFVLVIQAALLRWLGPEGSLSIANVFDLQWPAVISLFWSSLGAAFTIVARNTRSRSLWSVGAMVLVACAVKLVLFDFDSLGQLANILAVIAAGLVFLLVSWLAPLPPKRNEGGDDPGNRHDRESSLPNVLRPASK